MVGVKINARVKIVQRLKRCGHTETAFREVTRDAHMTKMERMVGTTPMRTNYELMTAIAGRIEKGIGGIGARRRKEGRGRKERSVIRRRVNGRKQGTKEVAIDGVRDEVMERGGTGRGSGEGRKSRGGKKCRRRGGREEGGGRRRR